MRTGGKSRIFVEQMQERNFLSGAEFPWAKSPAFVLSLHDGEPEDAAGNLANEVQYPGYQRARLTRIKGGGWERRGNVVFNANREQFTGLPVGSGMVVTHWALSPEGFNYPLYVGEFDHLWFASNSRAETEPLDFPRGLITVRES